MEYLESPTENMGVFTTYRPGKRHDTKGLIWPIFYMGIASDLKARDYIGYETQFSVKARRSKVK